MDWPELPMPREMARETQRPRVYVAAGEAEWPAVIDGIAPERAPRITVAPSGSLGLQSPAEDLVIELAADRSIADRIARRCLRAAIYVGTLPFRGVRALYRAIDTDAKVRSQGVQTVGRVEMTKTDTQVSKDPETGRETTTYTHYVSYSFPADRETRTDQKKVGSLSGVRTGSAIRVYFLHNGSRVDSALDWSPGALG